MGRRCTKCNTVKPATREYFSPSGYKRKDGNLHLHSWCKACQRDVARIRKNLTGPICERNRFQSPQTRFWLAVKKGSGCWEWIGSRNNDGYGQFSVDGSLISTHRYSYQLHFGPIPDGMQVLHRCDNPPYSRPDHLFLGTPLDNMQDRKKKGRYIMALGERNGQSKLTAAQVIDIRLKYQGIEVNKTEVGRKYGVSRHTIDSVLRGESWRSVCP